MSRTKSTLPLAAGGSPGGAAAATAQQTATAVRERSFPGSTTLKINDGMAWRTGSRSLLTLIGTNAAPILFAFKKTCKPRQACISPPTAYVQADHCIAHEIRPGADRGNSQRCAARFPSQPAARRFLFAPRIRPRHRRATPARQRLLLAALQAAEQKEPDISQETLRGIADVMRSGARPFD